MTFRNVAALGLAALLTTTTFACFTADAFEPPCVEAPAGLTASDDFIDRIELSWNEVEGNVVQYILERRPVTESTWTELYTGLELTFTDPPAMLDPGYVVPESGVSYAYRVRTDAGNGCVSDGGRAAVGELFIPAPIDCPAAAPENLVASQRAFVDRVELTWSLVPDANSYNVYRREMGGTFPADPLASPQNSVYIDNTAMPAVNYEYAVAGVNMNCTTGDTEGPLSAPVQGSLLTCPASAPTGLTASDGTFADRIELSWDEQLGTQQYMIQRSETGTDPWTDLPTVGAVTTFTDTDMSLAVGTTYTYRIAGVALNGCTDQGYSMGVTGSIGACPVDVPMNVAATDGTLADRVTITWDAVADTGVYRIYRSPMSGMAGDPIGETALLTYDDMSGDVGTTYYYTVDAWRDGCSIPMRSAEAAGASGLCAGAPTGVMAGQGTNTNPNEIEVTWDQEADAAGYKVEFSDDAGTNWTELTEITDPATTTYLHSDATALPSGCTVYQYRVISTSDTCPDSAPSMAVDGYWEHNLAAPATLTATDAGTTANQIDLTWDAVMGVTDYRVEFSDDAGTNWTVLTTTTGGTLTYSHNDATALDTACQIYDYRVFAVLDDCESAAVTDQGDWAVTVNTPMNPDTSTSACAGTGVSDVTFTWTEDVAVDSYEITIDDGVLPVTSTTYTCNAGTCEFTETGITVSTDYTVVAIIGECRSMATMAQTVDPTTCP